MFLVFTPYTMFFFNLYVLTLLLLPMTNSFFYYWLLMEFCMFLFMGVGFSMASFGFSSLVLYFLIQSVSSLAIFVFYFSSMTIFLSLAILLKLAMFPFLLWYPVAVYRLPNFMFLLTMTLHKLPSFLILIFFVSSYADSLIWASLVLTLGISCFMMLSTQDFRMLMTMSSVGNNSWFILAHQLSLSFFFLFFILYSLNLFIVIYFFKSSPSIVKSADMSLFSQVIMNLSVVSISGLPPFPVFFMKAGIILSLAISSTVSVLILWLLVFNALMTASYFQFLMKSQVSYYKNHIFMVL